MATNTCKDINLVKNVLFTFQILKAFTKDGIFKVFYHILL